MSEKQGKVYLIGAGPGHPELITVRGQRLLQECDAVVYDYLLADELIVLLPESVARHYVGKRAGQHTLPQDEINALLVTLAAGGKNVARLKGGDPFVFGRGGEEAQYLKDNGIAFEIVPGVTAGVAAPAFCGIPGTDRRRAPYIIFATGHEASDKDTANLNWQQLAAAHDGTLVIYMGVKQVAANITRLISGGWAPETPAAIIRRGTYADQQSWLGTLESLPQLVAEHQIKPPVLFVIGKVVELQPELEWFKGLPLLGKRIMVTRPAAQAEPLYRQLRDLGAEVLTYPTIKISEKNDTQGWIGFSSIAAPHRWLVFTSANGVRFFLKQFVERYGDIRKLSEFRIAAIGSGSERALHEYNLRADFIPSEATVATLTAEFVGEQQLDNTAVVRVRGDLADKAFEEGMARMQVHCVPLTLYRTESVSWSEGLKEKLLENRPDAAIFSSSSTVAGLRHNLAQDEIKRSMKDCAIISIGPVTSDALRDTELPITAEARVHTVPGLVETLLKHFAK